MKPPSNDADRPASGAPKAAAGEGSEAAKTAGGSAPENPSTAKPGASGAGLAPPITAGPKVEPGKTPPLAGQPAAAPSTTGPAASRPVTPPFEPARPGSSTGAAAGSDPGADPKTGPSAEAAKPDPATASRPKTEPLGTPKADASKAEPSKPSEPQRPGFGNATQGGPRTGAAAADGPIIDMKAKRVAEPAAGGDARGEAKAESKGEAKATSAGLAAGTAGADRASAPPPSDRAGSGGAPRVSATPPAAPPARGPSFGSVAAAGLLGGVIGAGLLFAVERAGLLGPAGGDTRIDALDQRVSGQFSALDQRMAALAPRDAVGALDRRVAANEAAVKPLPDAVRGAEAAAKQALDRAIAGVATAAAPAEGQASGATPVAAPAVPADLVARLDSLDQRVSALQEEPGREQPADPKTAAATPGDGGAVAALDGRLKALEGKGPGAAAAPADLVPKLASLQGEVEARTRANAEADQALGQRLDVLQKTLDDRVKAATESVQTATQASREAAEAGRTQAQETTKALDRRLQDQGEKIAALDKAVALRAEASTVQAALRVVTVDRIASALDAGAPYAEPLATLRKLETGDAGRIDALAPFAERGAPTADGLAGQFRPIAETLAASRKAAEARTVAASGDLKSRLLSMADSIVQVRRVDAPAPAETAEADPAGKVQAALDRGALGEAARAFETLPPEAKAQAGAFGATLKARAGAAQAVQALLSDAFKGMPAGASAAPEAGR